MCPPTQTISKENEAFVCVTFFHINTANSAVCSKGVKQIIFCQDFIIKLGITFPGNDLNQSNLKCPHRSMLCDFSCTKVIIILLVMFLYL